MLENVKETYNRKTFIAPRFFFTKSETLLFYKN